MLALPLADLGDVAAAPPQAMQAGDRAALDALGDPLRHRAGGGGDRPAGAGARDERAARASSWQPAGPTPGSSRSCRPDLVPAPEEAEAATLVRAAELVIAAIEDDWKRETLVPLDALASVSAAVPLADLAGWVQVRSELADLREVRSVQLVSLTQSQARVAISHAGDLGQLAAALARRRAGTDPGERRMALATSGRAGGTARAAVRLAGRTMTVATQNLANLLTVAASLLRPADRHVHRRGALPGRGRGVPARRPHRRRRRLRRQADLRADALGRRARPARRQAADGERVPHARPRGPSAGLARRARDRARPDDRRRARSPCACSSAGSGSSPC